MKGGCQAWGWMGEITAGGRDHAGEQIRERKMTGVRVWKDDRSEGLEMWKRRMVRWEGGGDVKGASLCVCFIYFTPSLSLAILAAFTYLLNPS